MKLVKAMGTDELKFMIHRMKAQEAEALTETDREFYRKPREEMETELKERENE